MIFSTKITNWYKKHLRALPWRESSDPYSIWLSEIILQQTRVDQGLDYYNKFTSNYPTIFDLAAASEDAILKDWQGLGYYSRDRNLHFTAKHIANELNGVFPNNAADLEKLKGVGPYTAAAIASIAFNESVPVIDGNVYRVLSRIFGVDTPIDSGEGKKTFKELANSLIDPKQPADFNQAMMEFGALQCVPRNPDCSVCPFQDQCEAKSKDLIHSLPVKSKKIAQRDRFFHYIVLTCGDEIFIEKRSGKGIWQNLYQFPLIEHSATLESDELLQHPDFLTWTNKKGIIKKVSTTYKHILSHQRIFARFWEVEIDKTSSNALPFQSIKKDDFEAYAIPRLIDRYWSDQ